MIPEVKSACLFKASLCNRRLPLCYRPAGSKDSVLSEDTLMTTLRGARGHRRGRVPRSLSLEIAGRPGDLLRHGCVAFVHSLQALWLRPSRVIEGEKKADVVEQPVFDHVGLLSDEPHGTADVALHQSSDDF